MRFSGYFTSISDCPPCTVRSDASDVCIKSLRSADSSGTLKNSELLYEVNTFKFPRNAENRLPAGGGISVWRGSTIKGNEIEYSVAVDIQINYYRSTSPASIAVVGFSAQVIPTITKSGAFHPPIWRGGFETLDNPDNGPVDPSYRNCIWTDSGRCGMAAPFFPDQTLELTLQMDNKLTGWLFGRMKDTRASVTPLSSTTSTVVVSGSSINVPSGVSWIPKSEFAISPGLQEMNYDSRVENDSFGPAILWGNSLITQTCLNFPDLGYQVEGSTLQIQHSKELDIFKQVKNGYKLLMWCLPGDSKGWIPLHSGEWNKVPEIKSGSAL